VSDRRRATVGAAAVAALLLASWLGGQEVSRSPIGPLPSGWTYLPAEGIDTWAMVFHDAESGACVTFEAAWPFVVRPTPASGAEVGTANGVRYHLKRGAAWRCKNRPALGGSFFPPDAADPSIVWSFSVDLCTDSRESRVREFILGRTLPVDPGRKQDQRKSRRISRELAAVVRCPNR
jgi:hypothetical protein